MRDHFRTGEALLAAVLLAAPMSAIAQGKIDQAEEKIKETAQGVKAAGSDSWLTSKTKIALFADERVKGREVRVETVKGEVFLRGKVDSEEAKAAAAEIAKGIEGVKDVRNDLQVVPPAERKAVTANDKEVTRQLQARFSKDPQLKRIDVRTDAGVVVLSGEVPSIMVSAKASEVAHRISGVKSVKNELRVAQAKAS